MTKLIGAEESCHVRGRFAKRRPVFLSDRLFSEGMNPSLGLLFISSGKSLDGEVHQAVIQMHWSIISSNWRN